MDVQAHIIVSGVVQGVGYRYFVMRAARKFHLTGWVKNKPNSQVEIQVEGPRGLIETLIRDLWTGNSWATVRNVDVHWDTYSGKYNAFDIAY